jgi:purine-cytosine permease-like protein
MLLQGTLISALLLGLLMAWSAGSIVCFAALTAWRPDKRWMHRILWSGTASAVLLGLVFGVDVWTGVDDLAVFVNYLVGTMIAGLLSLAYLAFHLVQRRS